MAVGDAEPAFDLLRGPSSGTAALSSAVDTYIAVRHVFCTHAAITPRSGPSTVPSVPRMNGVGTRLTVFSSLSPRPASYM